jgi:hypothetical protein
MKFIIIITSEDQINDKMQNQVCYVINLCPHKRALARARWVVKNATISSTNCYFSNVCNMMLCEELANHQFELNINHKPLLVYALESKK